MSGSSRKCKDNGGKVGFVTTTTPYTIDIIKKSLSNYINFEDFDIITRVKLFQNQNPQVKFTNMFCLN